MWIVARLSGAALAVALLLSGCVSTPAPAGPTPKPSATPIFASEAEALAAATKAYAAYQSTLDEAFSTYDDSRLAQVSSGSALSKARASAAEYKEAGKRQDGKAVMDKVSFVSSPSDDVGGDSFTAQTYLCLDLSGVDVIDRDGKSVVPPLSDRIFPIIATFKWDRSSQKLVVNEDESWSGANFCQN